MLQIKYPTPRFHSAFFAIIGTTLLLLSGLTTNLQATSTDGDVYRGKASFYGGYWHGRKTANGEIYDQNTLTAAHPSLRFGTKVVVKNLRNGREVTLRINNRGPYVKGRIIDVSRRAAQELRMTNSGVVPVQITVVPKDTPVGPVVAVEKTAEPKPEVAPTATATPPASSVAQSTASASNKSSEPGPSVSAIPSASADDHSPMHLARRTTPTRLNPGR